MDGFGGTWTCCCFEGTASTRFAGGGYGQSVPSQSWSEDTMTSLSHTHTCICVLHRGGCLLIRQKDIGGGIVKLKYTCTHEGGMSTAENFTADKVHHKLAIAWVTGGGKTHGEHPVGSESPQSASQSHGCSDGWTYPESCQHTQREFLAWDQGGCVKKKETVSVSSRKNSPLCLWSP